RLSKRRLDASVRHEQRSSARIQTPFRKLFGCNQKRLKNEAHLLRQKRQLPACLLWIEVRRFDQAQELGDRIRLRLRLGLWFRLRLWFGFGLGRWWRRWKPGSRHRSRVELGAVLLHGPTNWDLCGSTLTRLFISQAAGIQACHRATSDVGVQ